MRRKLKKKISQFKMRWSLMKRKMVAPPLPKNNDGKVLVHIGCGRIHSPEFINVDVKAWAHIHIITDDLCSMAQFEDSSVDLVYMCHILEHIKWRNLLDVLSEIKRILKAGGVLRLSVPDFDKLYAIYMERGRDVKSIIEPLLGGQEDEYNIHYTVFNGPYLTGRLLEAGFRDVIPWDPNNCQYHNFDDWASRKIKVDGKEYEISLNLEGYK